MQGAFDSVSHTAVLYKLGEMGIKGKLLDWLQSYLQDRNFRVMFEGVESSLFNAKSGVPQGGILSPLLFNVQMSDLPQNPNIQVSVYADDLAIYCTGTTFQEAKVNLQNYLDVILNWTVKWNQKINADKSKAMYFTNQPRMEHSLYFNNDPIAFVDTYKFLGIIIDAPV